MKTLHSRHLLNITNFSFAIWCGCINAATQNESEAPHWDVSIGIGAGVRTNPVMDNSDIPLIIIPQINYQANRFFIQNLDLGYTLSNTEFSELNILVTPSYDQVFFNEWDANNFVVESQVLSAGVVDSRTNNSHIFNSDVSGSTKIEAPTVSQITPSINKKKLHPRRMAALAGFEYSREYHSLDFQLQALHEVTDYYDGDEIRLAVSKNIHSGKHDVKLTLGANWQSERTLQYFYGLDAKDSIGYETYRPDDGISTLLRFDWNYQLTTNWSLRLLTSYRHLDNQIANSPLVTSNNVITAFVGGVYHF